MATAASTNAPAPPPPDVRRWNTLRVFRVGLVSVWALDALLLLAFITGAGIHRQALQTIGRNSAPGIIAAQHIKSALADMDANVANELLEPPAQAPDAVRAYERRRAEAAEALIAEAGDISSGDAERKPIERIQLGIGTYAALAQKARDLRDRRDSNFIDAYRDAAKALDVELLPAAEALNKTKLDLLDSAYRQQDARSWGGRMFVLAAAALLLGALLLLQVFLSERTHRTLNPLLLLATLLAFGFAAHAIHLMSAERTQLKIAKDQAFTSIRALWQARAAAYAAKSDERRYLLDRANAAAYERSFDANAAALLNAPDGHSPEQALTLNLSELKQNGYTGYLADELGNINFPGELEAATTTVRRWNAYVRIDAQIRSLERGGHHADAVTLCTDINPGESNWAFDQFDRALGRTLAINQSAFDGAVAKGFRMLSTFDPEAAFITAAIALLAYLGLRKRIQEYL